MNCAPSTALPTSLIASSTNARFRTKIDLLERMIVPDAIYNEIKDRITVRHAA